MDDVPPTGPKRDRVVDDATFQRRDWSAQRAARTVFRAIIVAALLGVLGHGPLSRSTRETSWGSVTYDRFLRARSRVVVHVRPHHDHTRIALEGIIDVEDEIVLVPEPLDQTISGRRRTVTIASNDAPSTLIIHWKPHGAGLRRGAISVDGEPVRLWSVVYP